jgi:hypothetical protein
MKAEFALELVFPLHEHGGRRRNQDQVDRPPQQQLANDQVLPKPTSSAHARQPQGLAQREH